MRGTEYHDFAKGYLANARESGLGATCRSSSNRMRASPEHAGNFCGINRLPDNYRNDIMARVGASTRIVEISSHGHRVAPAPAHRLLSAH